MAHCVAVPVLVSRWQTIPPFFPLFFFFFSKQIQRCSCQYRALRVNAFWSRSDVHLTFPARLRSVLPCCVWLGSKVVWKAAQLLWRCTHVTLIQYLCVCVCVWVCRATAGLRLTYITQTRTLEPVPSENCYRTGAESVSEAQNIGPGSTFRLVNIMQSCNVLYLWLKLIYIYIWVH